MHRRSYGTGSIFEKNGSVHFRFRPIPGRPQVQRKLARVGELNRKQLEAKAREVISEYKPPQDNEIPTFAEVGRMHVNRLQVMGRKPSYVNNRKRALRIHLNPEFGERAINAIRVKDVDRFCQRLLREGKGPTTVISVLSLASGIFKYAQRQEWRADNPAASVEKPKIDRVQETRYLMTEEFEKLILAVPDDEIGYVEKIIYWVALMTGMRRGELLALRWGHIDFQIGVIRVMANQVEKIEGTPKSGRGRAIPMIQALKDLLEGFREITLYAGPDDRVFGHPLTGKPLNESTTSKRFKRAVLKAKVGKIVMKTYKGDVEKPFPLLSLHSLRHTFGVRMAMDPKTALRELQEWLGHADAATTAKWYAHFQPTTDAAERIEAAFGDFRFGPSTAPQSESTSPIPTDPKPS